MNTTRTKLVLWLALIVVGVLGLGTGCSPAVGDACNSNAECAFGHLCDTSAPGGYCLIVGCRANSCPEESWCASFRINDRSQSFCLRKCKSDGDCRDGYRCRTDVGSPGGVCYVAPP